MTILSFRANIAFMTKESAPQTQKPTRTLSRNAERLIGAALIPAAAISGAVIAHQQAERSDKTNQLKAELSQKTEALANAKAAEFTSILYDSVHNPKGIVKMQVINGEIITTTKDGVGATHTGTYKNPILLATADVSAVPDKDGKFLKGAYIGITGGGVIGNAAVINAVPVDTSGDTVTFKAYDPAHVMLPDNIAVYATTVTGTTDELIGFDPTGETHLVNGDGSLVTPGLSQGMK